MTDAVDLNRGQRLRLQRRAVNGTNRSDDADG